MNALELQNNSIRDLTPIRGHDALEYLDVRGNPIEVFAGVESMGIDTLYMDAPGTEETSQGEDAAQTEETPQGEGAAQAEETPQAEDAVQVEITPQNESVDTENPVP